MSISKQEGEPSDFRSDVSKYGKEKLYRRSHILTRVSSFESEMRQEPDFQLDHHLLWKEDSQVVVAMSFCRAIHIAKESMQPCLVAGAALQSLDIVAKIV